MLVGREIECARLDGLLADTRVGSSGVLVLRGEAGIGKTALCEYAAERADGMTVLAVRGIETESELAFSGLADLLRPVVERLDELPPPQAAALAGALAIAPPVSGDRFATCVATLSLLSLAAEEKPLLAIVDEVQWLDSSSAEAVLFAARRLDAEGIALLLAVRDGYTTAVDRAEFHELRLTGLDDADARALLGSTIEGPVAAEVADQILAIAAGNPLALVEVPSLLTPDQLAGSAPLDGDFPAAAAVEHAFLRQVEVLPDRTRQALLVAAASDSGNPDEILAAMSALGLEAQALEPAERAGVVSIDDAGLRFRHPLLRSGVYRSASSVARRTAHEALARAADTDRLLDRRAWHLASAAQAQDEQAAEALAEAGLQARLRGGHAEAAGALERAALLGHDGARRAERLREAAGDAWLAGRAEKARELLEAGLDASDDLLSRARIQHLRGVLEMWHGSPTAGRELLCEEAARIEGTDPARAGRMLTDATWACFMAAEITTGLETAERACAVARSVGGPTETLAKAALGIALALGGEPQRALLLFSDYLAHLDEAESSLHGPRLLRPDGQVLTWFEQYDRAWAVLTHHADSARAQSALGALPYTLAALSDLDFRTGNWVTAYAGAAEAVRIADETDQAATLAFSLSCLARVEAAQGREDDCRSHVVRALEIADPGVGAVVAFSGSALGLLELGLGRADEAIGHLEKLAGQVAEHGLGDPGVIQWAPDLIEAYARAGREDDANRTLEEFEAAAWKTERAWALAAAARCRGLLAGDGGFDGHFKRALELHGKLPTPFERARTELCLGERLRRARRRVEARQPLRCSLEAFDRLGAAPWAERARVELAASGETARQRHPYAAQELTPQELQVALLVARGATNKEAGAALFLSPKTIETHLGRVYRKLNVRSRTELAHLLSGDSDLVAPSGQSA
jgi:DNA-binding CsgD family transcriptional regulator